MQLEIKGCKLNLGPTSLKHLGSIDLSMVQGFLYKTRVPFDIGVIGVIISMLYCQCCTVNFT